MAYHIRAKNFNQARRKAKSRGLAVRSVKKLKKQPKSTGKKESTYYARPKINTKTTGKPEIQRELRRNDYAPKSSHPRTIKGFKGKYYTKSGRYHKQKLPQDAKIKAEKNRPPEYPSWRGDIKGKKI